MINNIFIRPAERFGCEADGARFGSGTRLFGRLKIISLRAVAVSASFKEKEPSEIIGRLFPL